MQQMLQMKPKISRPPSAHKLGYANSTKNTANDDGDDFNCL